MEQTKTQKYAATYKFGNTTVNIVAPPPKTPEEIERILKEYHQAAWECWQSILEEEKENITEETTHVRGIPIIRL